MEQSPVDARDAERCTVEDEAPRVTAARAADEDPGRWRDVARRRRIHKQGEAGQSSTEPPLKVFPRL